MHLAGCDNIVHANAKEAPDQETNQDAESRVSHPEGQQCALRETEDEGYSKWFDQGSVGRLNRTRDQLPKVSLFSIALGAYELPQFVELNIRSCRNIFGDVPLLVYCGAGRGADKIKELADRFDCSFVSDGPVNRAHFLGDLQNAVCAVAFAKANGCKIGVKINQRYLLLGPEIPERLEAIFNNPDIDLAMPTPPKVGTIIDPKSRFHASMPSNPAFIAMRTGAFDAQKLADDYAEQVRNSKHRNETLTEVYWAWVQNNQCKDRWTPIPWLSEPSHPPMYLQKCQHSQSDYNRAALSLGMAAGNFPVQEWQDLARGNYRPIPRL